MRWDAKPTKHWKPWFAFLPMRWHDGRMIWLEPIWVRWCADWSEWMPWEMRPNDPPSSAKPMSMPDPG